MSQQINLANPQLLRARHALGLREMAVALGVVLLAMFAWAAVLSADAGELEQKAVAAESRQAATQTTVDQLLANAGRPASPLLTQRIRQTESQIALSERLLGAINTTLAQTSAGFSGRMTALARSSLDGVWLTGLTLAPDHVELKGSALDAHLLTRYIDRLGTHASFAGTRFSGLTATESAAPAGEADKTSRVPGHLNFTLHAGPDPKGTTP